MKRILYAFLLLIATVLYARSQPLTPANKATFINNLMSKMTLDEKIGQLNLVTPGGAVTGSVVSQDVDEKIRKGLVGGLFGITGPSTVARHRR